MGEERRAHHRHACLVEVHGMHGERFFCGRAHDLSASGAFVECDTSPARGESVILVFDVPPRLYRLTGTVVGGRDGALRGFAVTFETVGDKARAVARALAGEAREVMRRPVLRSHLRVPCQVRLLGATGSRIFDATALDVSPVGAFLVTGERFAVGSFLTVRFRKAKLVDHDVPAVARWRREADGKGRPAGLGVAFLREEQTVYDLLKGATRAR